MNKQEMFDKFIEFMGRFAEIRAVAALRDGFIMTTPFTICGSVFLLLANLPIPGYAEFMAGIFVPNWTDPLNAVSGATFSVLALIAVLAITYKYVEGEGCDAMMASILALSTFLILLPPSVAAEGGAVVDNIIPKAWAGSNGVITAILVSFVVSWVFCYCEKNHIGIKMPPAVPGGVAKAFEALTPGMILFTLGAVIYGLCHFVGTTTFPELIFTERGLRDDVDVPRCVNNSVLDGQRNDIEIFRCRGIISDTPVYQAYLAQVNAIKEKYADCLLLGKYNDVFGFTCSNATLDSRSFISQDGKKMVVVVANQNPTDNKVQNATITVPGYRYKCGAVTGNGKQSGVHVSLKAYDMAVLLFVK